MPVSSLTSSVLRWPDRSQVDDALRAWVPQAVESSDQPFERRSLDWDLLDLPVPAEVVIYTREEWKRLMARGGRFAKTLEREARWLFDREYKRWDLDRLAKTDADEDPALAEQGLGEWADALDAEERG